MAAANYQIYIHGHLGCTQITLGWVDGYGDPGEGENKMFGNALTDMRKAMNCAIWFADISQILCMKLEKISAHADGGPRSPSAHA